MKNHNQKTGKKRQVGDNWRTWPTYKFKSPERKLLQGGTHKKNKARNSRMSKTYAQDKTQQDLRKYWNITTLRSATKEKEQTKNSTSSNSDPNTLEQSSSDNTLKQSSNGNNSISNNVNDKKRKAPVKEKNPRRNVKSPNKKNVWNIRK